MSEGSPGRGTRRLRDWALGALQNAGRSAITEHPLLWPVAIALGIAVGYAVTGFRLAISFLQTQFYGVDDTLLHTVAAGLPWYLVLFLPVAGGLVVGAILRAFTPNARAQGIAEVIEAAALSGGRVARRAGLASAAAALVTLSTGGSSGREGPAVHIGAVMSSWVARRLHASALTGRDLLGCAAAAAVSASFNAPLAGVLFALEVVLRHFALHAFGPIVMAGIAATVVSRIHMGDVTEFVLPGHTLAFYLELPAFVLLGLASGVIAAVMVRGIFIADEVGDRIQRAGRIPDWMRPGVAGLLLGLIALQFPHIIGVGYETTTRALMGQIPLATAMLFGAVKAAAVAITLAGRMGGGVFSPALMMGALTGSAFGAVAIPLFPEVAGSQGLYALAGMGAVAGAVLGAPISTTLVVFELTGDWQAGIAVMVAVALSSVVANRLMVRSYFLTQLAVKGLHLAAGPQGYLKRTVSVASLVRPLSSAAEVTEEACQARHRKGQSLQATDTLARALPVFDREDAPFLPVMRYPPPGTKGAPDVVGVVFHVDALKAHARVLEEELREEHC